MCIRDSIIPCYNEALTIGKVIDDFHRELPQATVYVYDNNSSDDTSRIATEHGATVRFEPRQGKGNVCRQMFRAVSYTHLDVYKRQALRPWVLASRPSRTASRSTPL